MEKKTQNRDLYINIQEKRRNCLQKTACTLIVFIFILLPSIQFSLNRVIRDDVRNSSISLLFQKAIADQWSLKTDAYSYLKGPGWDILAGFSFEYFNRGEYQFADADGAAYRNIQINTFYDLMFVPTMAFIYQNFVFGLDLELNYHQLENQPGFFFNPLGFITWNSDFGIFLSSLELKNCILTAEIGYRYEFLWEKVHINTGLFCRFADNPVLKASIDFSSWNKELCINLSVRQGLQKNVYELFSLKVSKKLGNYNLSLSFSPSLNGNNLYETQIVLNL
ncbi:MAG: hypothetical protein A2355_05150 [Spirochaetes bacterium RIFOXYB1_FULL_32_8]|nr:MAG: hypothetical protein A2355_05150 [Spirochaetes bacterium RIFOXYB1_FULL_32_8]